MARKVKCPECGTYNDKENTVYHNSKYYCKICFENKQKEAQDYKNLVAYICELYQIEAPTRWMLKQIKDYKEQFNFTYRGIKTTLHYFYEIQEGNSVEDSMGIGIVPFVYDEAKRLKGLLGFFREIDKDIVPQNSILREFIGGSIFYKY